MLKIVSSPKFWISVVGFAFTVGGIATAVELGQSRHANMTNDIHSITKVHAEAATELLREIKEQRAEQRQLLEKLVIIAARTCSNTAKTEAGHTNCIQ